MNNEVLQGQQDLFLLVTVRVRIHEFLTKGEVRPWSEIHECGRQSGWDMADGPARRNERRRGASEDVASPFTARDVEERARNISAPTGAENTKGGKREWGI